MTRIRSRTLIRLIQLMVFICLTIGFVVVIRERSSSIDWSMQGVKWLWPAGVVAIGLMPINWCLEMIKFQKLMKVPGFWPNRQFLQSVLAGITVSMFLPNRMGEFAGRVLFFPPEKRLEACSATWIGSLLQSFWIACAGGFVLLLSGQWPRLSQMIDTHYVTWIAVLVVGILGSGFLLSYKRISGLFSQLVSHFRNILGSRAVTTAWVWALLRYVTYCIQFVLLLRFAGVASPVSDLVGFAIIFFFLQTILPLPPALGWLARIQLAVVLGGVLVIQPMQAILASLLLWIINLVIPGLLGGYFLLNQHLYKHLSDVRTAFSPD
ncbi:MAG: hypothetical protein IPJ06_20485 [Saprospiraceae bacterium]|nr:hypothetical protein [Saprospiraceae bacterium]